MKAYTKLLLTLYVISQVYVIGGETTTTTSFIIHSPTTAAFRRCKHEHRTVEGITKVQQRLVVNPFQNGGSGTTPYPPLVQKSFLLAKKKSDGSESEKVSTSSASLKYEKSPLFFAEIINNSFEEEEKEEEEEERETTAPSSPKKNNFQVSKKFATAWESTNISDEQILTFFIGAIDCLETGLASIKKRTLGKLIDEDGNITWEKMQQILDDNTPPPIFPSPPSSGTMGGLQQGNSDNARVVSTKNTGSATYIKIQEVRETPFTTNSDKIDDAKGSTMEKKAKASKTVSSFSDTPSRPSSNNLSSNIAPPPSSSVSDKDNKNNAATKKESIFGVPYTEKLDQQPIVPDTSRANNASAAPKKEESYEW
mmetsp:Transcript_19165/g.28174  ORF Transcript_19165/g.28174 Transcript_19165/m.28174 type:complete len:367 (-) Transcript_19165:1004-2104(-)